MEEIMMLRPKEVVCKWVDAFNGHDVFGETVGFPYFF